MIYLQHKEGLYRNGINILWWRAENCGRSVEVILYWKGIGRLYFRWRQKISPYFIYDWSNITGVMP